jgi:hypothetical protein
MAASVADAVSHALPVPVDDKAPLDLGDGDELREELERVALEALGAAEAGIPLNQAVRHDGYPALRQFHQDLRDSMFLEIPKDLRPWVERLQASPARSEQLGQTLTRIATADEGDAELPANADLQRALAEVLVFESVRLRLLVAAWQSEEFERLGGEEEDVDDIAWEEVSALLAEPIMNVDGVRPLQVMYASASVALARDAADRADELIQAGGDLREELSMRAKLRAALRELRLTESVLLENALSTLLGSERVELKDLQERRPVALEGLSRQAMDQRVSRGRRALTRPRQSWPRRRTPALFDLLRDDEE